jgi:hypothetical protein
MEKDKITSFLFFIVSGVVGVIFLSSIVVIGEQTDYLNRLAVMNKNKGIDYFINFDTIPDSKLQFSKYLSKFPNLIYQNPRKGVFFFDIKNKSLKTNVEKVIQKIQGPNVEVEVFSNSKTILQDWRMKDLKKNKALDVHLIESPYICFTNRCFDNFIGFQLMMKSEITKKSFKKTKGGKGKNDA